MDYDGDVPFDYDPTEDEYREPEMIASGSEDWISLVDGQPVITHVHFVQYEHQDIGEADFQSEIIPLDELPECTQIAARYQASRLNGGKEAHFSVPQYPSAVPCKTCGFSEAEHELFMAACDRFEAVR